MKTNGEKRALTLGMSGCLLYVIGDFLYAWTGKGQSTDSIGLVVRMLTWIWTFGAWWSASSAASSARRCTILAFIRCTSS